MDKRRLGVLWRACAIGVLVFVTASSAIAYAAISPAAQRGWLPMIVLAGARDSARAVHTLRELAKRWAIALEHTEIDASTRDFLDRTTDSLRDFNLAHMYKLLPEKDGTARRLGVSGEFAGGRYVIRRRSHRGFEVGPQGSRQHMGDASLVLRASALHGRADDDNYLLQGRAGIVVGPIGWPMVVGAAQQLLHLVGSTAGPGTGPRAQSRQQVRADNPKLGNEDVEPIATLLEAFPNLGEVVRSLGTIDDLVGSEPMPAPGLRRVHTVMHLDPDKIEAHYPELADYLDDLGDMLEADLRWVDAHNRTIALLHVNSRHLSARLELFQQNGLLVPSRGGRPFPDQPIEAGIGTFHYRLLASTLFQAFGLHIRARDVRLTFQHKRGERGMELRAQMQHIPNVHVSGAALGFVPTGVIDWFIPGDIEGLVARALQAACHGNNGKGVELQARFDRRPSGQATLDGAFAFEAIDDFLFKLGVSHFNNHVMPDEDARADMARLMKDVQRAFSADLDRYSHASTAAAVN